MKLQFQICRYSAEIGSVSYDTFQVPYSDGMTILDALNFIQKKCDQTVAFRWECRSGICGTCGVMVNGKPVLGCFEKVDKDVKKYVVEPLANFPIERDLIVDLSLLLERLKRTRPYLQKKKDVIVTKAQADLSKPFRKCIECGCCVAASETMKKQKYGIIDPMTLVKLARFFTDPRDGLDRKTIAQVEGVDVYSAKEAKRITKVCPRGVPIDKAVELLQNK